VHVHNHNSSFRSIVKSFELMIKLYGLNGIILFSLIIIFPSSLYIPFLCSFYFPSLYSYFPLFSNINLISLLWKSLKFILSNNVEDERHWSFSRIVYCTLFILFNFFLDWTLNYNYERYFSYLILIELIDLYILYFRLYQFCIVFIKFCHSYNLTLLL